MIFDSLTHWNTYLLNPIFRNVFQLLKNIDFENNLDKIVINKDVFIKHILYETKYRDWVTESHKKYVDIQILLTGSEIIRVYNNEELCSISDYNYSTDCIFYDSIDALTKNCSILTLRPGYMAVFFPNDAHMTQIVEGENPQSINKIVIKAHEKLFI